MQSNRLLVFWFTLVLASSFDLASALTMPSEKINWLVRPATEEDERAVNKLLHKSFSTILPQYYTEEVLEGALPRMTTARKELLTCGTWYVALHPDTKDVVGCGGWTPRTPATRANNLSDETDTSKEQSTPHLRHFASDPSWARHGIASAIWGQIEQDLASHGFGADMPLEVFSTLSAEAFYASKGFVPQKRMEARLAEDVLFPCILMRRERCSESLQNPALETKT